MKLRHRSTLSRQSNSHHVSRVLAGSLRRSRGWCLPFWRVRSQLRRRAAGDAPLRARARGHLARSRPGWKPRSCGRTGRTRRRAGAALSVHRGARLRQQPVCVGPGCARPTWRVKWGAEVHTETFASRLAWAAGYFVEVNYFVPRRTHRWRRTALQRARACIEQDGTVRRRALRARRTRGRQAFRRTQLGLERQSVRRHARAERTEDRDDAGVELG